MTDLHVHLLPGLDDGPADTAAAVALLGALVAEGVRAAVATPHVVRGLYEPRPETVRAALDLLGRAAQAAGLEVVPALGMPDRGAREAATERATGGGAATGVESGHRSGATQRGKEVLRRGILPSESHLDFGAGGLAKFPVVVAAAAEYRLEPDLPEYLARTGALTIGGRFLLLEWPFESVPGYTDRVVFELQLAGYVPVLAHPERNTVVQRRPELVLRRVERGVLVQVTAASFLGVFGSRARGAAEWLLRAGAVHVVASDAHDARERPPYLAACYRHLARLAGEETARALLVANPARLMQGEAL
ncbi:MAG: tyrosine-protein phosphatase [Desulfotomaculales bacterium]